MKHAYVAFPSVVLSTLLAVVQSCVPAADCVERRNCPKGAAGAGTSNDGGSGDAGEPGAAGAAGAAGHESTGGSAGSSEVTPCDPNGDPATNTCAIDDQHGTFVAPYGDDETGEGTQSKPFATVTRALSAVADQTHPRLYVCADEYTEPGTISFPDGSAVFGGFSCDGGAWTYDAPVKALLTVASPVGGVIASAQHGVTIEDVRIDAGDASQNGPGASSFGLFVQESKGVSLVRVEVRAGKGGAGTSGTTPSAGQAVPPSTTAQDGRNVSCSPEVPATALGGTPADSKCGSGGKGGIGYGSFDHSGASGLPTTNLISAAMPNGGAAVTAADPANTPGRAGGKGLDGAPGELGSPAEEIGSFTIAGYLGAAGGDGTNGASGQGGGGGGASLGGIELATGKSCTGAGGGSGGAGGCGGKGGPGGGGGGASVALFSWNSEVSFASVVLRAKSGGAGGRGASGGSGSAGVDGGAGGSSETPYVQAGGHGGKGGSGGSGGPGAGGSGGPSIALVYKGMEPSGVSGAQLSAASGGAGGPGGAGASLGAVTGSAGKTGLAQSAYAVP